MRARWFGPLLIALTASTWGCGSSMTVTYTPKGPQDGLRPKPFQDVVVYQAGYGGFANTTNQYNRPYKVVGMLEVANAKTAGQSMFGLRTKAAELGADAVRIRCPMDIEDCAAEVLVRSEKP